MSPHRIDPNINYQRLQQLSEEFMEVWKRLQAHYLDATAGFAFVRSCVDREQSKSCTLLKGTGLDSEEYLNTRSFTYEQIFTGSFCTSGIHDATQGEVKARNAPNGVNFVSMGQLCLISFYDYWEEYLRREYAVAKGKLDPTETRHKVINKILSEYASHDLWGDVRLLRISIVHHQGIATSDVSKCRLIKWFKPGDPIMLTPDHMRALFLAFLSYRNELFRERFPEHYIKITSR